MKKLLREKMTWLLVAVGICGVLLFGIGSFFGDREPEKPTTVGDPTVFEESLRELLGNLEGVGEVKLYVRMAGELPDGIAVLCEGGNDPTVQKQVIGLLTALYPIGAHRIYVGKG